ncbi:type I polyketide synthase [Streptomonospora litoralis]|uniref:Erythronolide synthase, modules 5 and 6 n=1 Tax=Streptomonospora litoralis TaxID=2498135 RepID=A0A4V0ZJW2_9ACTN|nr:type I polyketide synthase [Streptomonospora litoralis]QBI54872.1 Erythronolide synthase, modules 5 and 6 [Streptomonospora litoralis]
MTANETRLRDYLKQTTAELRATRSRLREHEERGREPIAIVGMACRFPGGVRSPEDLWDVVEPGRDVVAPFPADRGWDTAGIYDPQGERSGTTYAREGGFLEDVALFDAGFFDISPREATSMDPQQRIFLETSWEAFERSGIVPASLRGSSTGVYLGATDHDYGRGISPVPDHLRGNLLIGRSGAISAGRVSYVFGLEGPALTVDTMCSSSLVAMHLATEGLRRDECTLALAGGTTVMSTPEGFIEFSAQQALAPDGRCKSFGAAADGTGWCEGVGVALLERLSDARRNGHPVLAVVRGGAVNQDGASNGLTAPNGRSQRRVIKQALRSARVTAEEVDLVEAHGTGTSLGDPVEAHALLATYGQGRDGLPPLRLGSLKSNFGHAAAAAGIGGVIKTVMALRNGVMPRTLHAEEPSPAIDWSSGRVELLAENRPWERNGHPRRAGVSAFGASGTNAHLILEEAPEEAAPAEEPEDSAAADDGAGTGGTGAPAARQDTRTAGGAESPAGVLGPGAPIPWLLSARSETALADQARRLADHLARRPGTGPADVAWSLATARTAFEHRAVVTGTGAGELTAGLDALAAGAEHPRLTRGRVVADRGRTVFVFPGQGAQWPGMARGLAEGSPVFAAALRECADALDPLVDWPAHEVLRNGGDSASAVDTDRVDVVQPALFAAMVALARTWRACGVEPAAVVGHSQGEIAAACVAGALSLEDAARVVALRSRRLREIAGGGGMLSVGLSRDRALDAVAQWPDLSLAAVNGARSAVVSGAGESLDGLAAQLERADVRTRRIPVDYASHSHHVERLHAGISADLAGVSPRSAEVPLYSTVTGEAIDTSEMGADYWYRNLRATVELDAAVHALSRTGHTTFAEVSPHPVVLPAIEETLDRLDTARAVTGGTLRRDEGDLHRFLASASHLHTRGVGVDWPAVLADLGGAPTDLPTYAFQGRRYWMEAAQPDDAGSPDGAAGAEADAEFWEMVSTADPQTLAENLGIDPAQPFSAAVPALARWRERHRRRRDTDTWRYHESWVPLQEAAGPRLSGRWLLLDHERGGWDDLRRGIADQLGRHGARVERIVLAEAEEGRAALGARLRDAAAGGVAGVVSLLALDRGEQPGHPGLPRALASTFTCVQAFADSGIDARLWAATCGAAAVGDTEHVAAPDQTAVWGLGRVAALELPDRWGGLVDLPADAALSDSAARRFAGALLAGTEDQIAVRSPAAYGRRLRRVDAAAQRAPRWRPRDTVLLTGGTGGVGAQVARWLAELGAPRLVLTSRRGGAAPGAEALAAELRELGTDVEIAACDAADRDAFAAIRERAAERGRPVRAVLHMAGAGVLRALDATDTGEYADTTYAKIAGADVLDELFSEPGELDEFVLFSSISAAWGSGEHGAYASANAYLDGLADSRRGRGLPGRSVVWGIWAPRDGGGMAAGLAEEQLRSRGIPFMDPAAALEGFHRVLDDDRAVEVLAEVDWESFAPVFTMARPSPLLETIPEAESALRRDREEAGEAGESSLAERLAGMRPVDRARALSELVRSRIAAVLDYAGPDEVDPDRALRELGFDSLTAVDLRNRLTTATGLRLPVTVVFDHPNAAALATHIGGLLLPAGDSGGGEGGDADRAPVPDAGPDEIGDMDVDSLVQLALRSETQRGEG